MFYTLSNVFWFFAQPLNLAIFLLVAGLLAAAARRRHLAWTGICLSGVILVVACWTTTGALLMGSLEERFHPPVSAPATIDGVVVLGGGFDGPVNLARGGHELNEAGDRFVEAAILARRYPQAKIVISGGVGEMLTPSEADAVTAPRLLGALGVDPARLVLEGKSRNTYENAIFSKQMVQPKPGETWLLVTSAFHMPRAQALFDKAGFATIPWPVDYRTTGKEGIGLFKDGPTQALDMTTLATREWIGLFAYWLTGKIDTPFPRESSPGG